MCGQRDRQPGERLTRPQDPRLSAGHVYLPRLCESRDQPLPSPAGKPYVSSPPASPDRQGGGGRRERRTPPPTARELPQVGPGADAARGLGGRGGRGSPGRVPDPGQNLTMNKKIFIVAGEASGDLHAADLARALLSLDPEVTLLGMGGEQMRRAGVTLHVDAGELAAVGITEALSGIAAVLRALARLRSALDAENPALLLLIDFPDFTFWMARASRRREDPDAEAAGEKDAGHLLL